MQLHHLVPHPFLCRKRLLIYIGTYIILCAFIMLVRDSYIMKIYVAKLQTDLADKLIECYGCRSFWKPDTHMHMVSLMITKPSSDYVELFVLFLSNLNALQTSDLLRG